MNTKFVTVCELRGPEDCGSYLKKGSLVLLDGVAWRVNGVRPSSGTIDLDLMEERPPAVQGAPRELSGPRRRTANVLPTTRFEVVVDNE